MICSLSKDDKNYSVYLKLYEYLAANFNDIMKSPDASIDVNAMMKEMYADVLAKTGDHELGVRFARMVPTVLFNIAAKDIENIGNMMAKGFDPTATAKLAAVAISPETGIEYIEKELGISRNIADEIKEIDEATPKKKSGRKKKVVNDMPEGQLPKDQLLLFDEDGNPIVADVSGEGTEDEIVYPEGTFEAVAPHALKDTDNEALSMDKGNKGYNVIDPAKKLFYTVKRAILRMLNGKTGSEINYPGVGGVYLRAQSSKLLPQDELLKTTTPVVLVVVDQFGNPVLFNDKGEVDPKGKHSFYNLRNPYDIDGAYEKERITAIANTQKITYEAAKAAMLKERAIVEKILDYVSKDPSNTVGMQIDGGSLGTLGDVPGYYFLSSVNFPTDAVRIQQIKGEYFFSLPSVSSQNIRLKQMTFAERPDLVNLLADLMVEDIHIGGVTLNNMDKKAILDKYVMLNANTISMVVAGPRVMGEVLDVSTPEAREAAKQKIKDAFNSLMPMGKPLEKADVSKRTKYGANIVSSVEGAKNGDILVVKDQETGEDIYRVLRNMTLNITEQGQNDNRHFALTPREDGGMDIEYIEKGYFNNYIKENFQIDKLLNADNELTSLNAYFTFVPLDSETAKIDNVSDEEEQEEVDEFTRILNEQAKKAKEAFDALPIETKQAIEILDNADTSMPMRGATYSFHVAQLFENNLRKKLYTREQAEKILEALASEEILDYVPFRRKLEYKFRDKVLSVARENVERYTRPTQPELTGGPTVSKTTTVNKSESIAKAKKDLISKANEISISAYSPNKDFAERINHDEKIVLEVLDALNREEQYRDTNGDKQDEILELFYPALSMKNIDALIARYENITYQTANVQNTTEKLKKLKERYDAEIADLEGTATIGTAEMKDPLDTTEPPPSTEEKKRRTRSRKSDASNDELKKNNPDDPFLGGRVEEDNDDVWSTRVIQLSGGKITQEDIDVAKAWYEKHPLSKHFSFREMFDMVNEQNPDSIATWSMNGIILYKGSNHTQLYHEAFHAFTQAFMTPAQREALYSEARKMTGTFKDYEGKMVPFKYATDKQVEEYLAEEFRQYMLSQGKMAIKSAPARKSFFKKLLDVLEILFGNMTIGEVMADSNASSEIKNVFNALRKGDMTGYKFQKPDVRFNNTLDSTGIQALNEEATFSNLSKKDTKVLLDSIDGWIAQSVDTANSGLTTPQAIEDYLKLQVDMMMNRVSPAQMERMKLEMASKLTYSQSVNFLKTKAGRTLAYRRVEFLLSNLQLALDEEYRKLKAAGIDNEKLQDIREKLGLVMFARENFGDLDNLENNRPDKDGVTRGVIAFHMARSKDFGTKAIEMLDADETADDNKATRSEYADRSGAEVSQKELAKAEVKYLFRTIYKMDPKTKAPVTNELGSPVLMDQNEVWGKVSTILENELDPSNMYNKLVKYAQQETPTEMSMAIAQLINKLGPRGLSSEEFPHLNNRTVENLWTNFWVVFNMRRVPLASQTVDVIYDEKTKTQEVQSKIGRAINPYAAVGKAWNSKFPWNRENEYVTFDEGGIAYLNTKKLLKDFPDVNALKTKGEYDIDKVFKFLRAIGIDMSDTAEVRDALQNGSSELNIYPNFHIVETLLLRNSKRVKDDPINNDKNGATVNPNYVKGYSLLEIISKNGIPITKPQDLFSSTRMDLIGGYLGTEDNPLYISGLPGEMQNWKEIQAIEGQYGSGIPSFMVTTADGNTKFEQSLNSTMSVMVTSVNSVEDDEESSAYEKLTQMPYMAKFDIDKNPNAKRYVWLTNMFNIVDSKGNLIPKSDPEWGKRKTATGGKLVKLELYDISGARTEDKGGVSSASADPYTKFVLDLHLAVQKGLPELMRHSDKSTSYSVILNYITSPSGDVTQGQYIANYRFEEDRDSFHTRAFNQYILPNLTSEHDRVRRFMQKKKDIDKTLAQIAKEKKAGKQKTPTPVFDFNYLAQGQKFLMFEGILNESTKSELSKVEGDLTEYLAQDTPEAKALKKKIFDETKNYFEGQYDEVKAEFAQYGFVADNLLKSFSAQVKDKMGKYYDPNTRKSALENMLLNSWVYNSWINNVESMNFLYGDIALYNHAKEEFHKRNAGIASTGTLYRTDQGWLDYVNRELGRKFEEQLTGEPMRAYDGTMNTGVMRDKITRSVYLEEIGYNLYRQMVDEAVNVNNLAATKRSKSEIETEIKIKLFGKAHASKEITSIEDLDGIQPGKGSIMSNYNKMNEADAQGWISFDAYRILMDSQGEWTPAQENIYQAILRGETLPAEKIGTYFPPIKAQYWGALNNDSSNPYLNDVTIEAFHKFQLTPIVPTLADVSPKLKSLHEKMMREGIDYALFESGSKVGTLTSVQFDEAGMPLRVDEDGNVLKSTDKGYSSKLNIASLKDDIYTEDREINEDTPFTKNTINVQFLKNQLKIEPKWKNKVTFATQIRKLIEVDLMENGIPTDYRVGQPIEDRILTWFNLSFEEQLAASQNFRDIIDYEKAVYNLTNVKKAQLLKKAKLSINSDGELVGNKANLIKYVKSQLSNQELADHELDFINTDNDGNLTHDLSFSLAADKIEKLLNALVVKSLIRQTVKGESLIQVSGAMTELRTKLTDEEKRKWGGTNGLAYYKINPITGRVDAMKVKIAMQGDYENLLYLPEVAVFVDALDKEGNVQMRKGQPVKQLDYNASLANLNRLIKDNTWLDKGNNRKMVSMHGDRIPIQGLNSDEFAEVYEFLPKEAGNIVILPAEIVAKSGGDFDIDKLTFMMPNIGKSSEWIDDQLVYSVDIYTTLSTEEMRERYNAYKEAFAKKYLTEGIESKADRKRALDLHFTLFGGKDQVFSSVIDLALEEGEILSFEEFSLADQEKVAQNDLLFAMNNITSKPENYSNLVRPNGTDILDPIVDTLKESYRNYNPGISTNDAPNPKKGIQASKIFEITYNKHKHMTNNIGKKALGIGAVDNTYNQLFNRIGLYLTPNNKDLYGAESAQMAEVIERAREFYKQAKTRKSKYIDGKDTSTKEEKEAYSKANKAFTKEDRELFDNYERQTLFLPHNKLQVKGFDDPAISFSHRYDAKGEHKIGDVISQLMNGWVDIAKDPWIFYLRGNDKLGPMLLFLVQAGVPIKDAGFFVSQPIIEEYIDSVDKLQSIYSAATADQSEEDVITRDKAMHRAKEMILEKLGIEVEGSKSADRIKNMNEIIKREILLTSPENDMFLTDDLQGQLDYVNKKYPKFDKKGRPVPIADRNIDYTDDTLSDMQKAIFLHFIQMTNMERATKDIKLRTNVDTAKSGSLYEAQDKIIKLQELKRSRTDDTKNTQTKYWRIPSDVIDRLIPTIKDKEGNYTTVLDESKVSSPIASFYQQPFQIAVWSDLFTFRNNWIINRFLTDLSFTDKDTAKNITYFEDDIELMSEFKSAMLPILFQNEFLTYDVEKLKNPKEPVYYKGSEVRLEKVEALPKYGVAFVNNVMYYDYSTLWKQFNSKSYMTDSVETGIVGMDANTFSSFGEYVKFVFEREYLRNDYAQKTYSDMEALRKSNEDFNNIWKAVGKIVKKEDYLGEGEEILRKESKKEYSRERLRHAFEIFLRNQALKNVYNMHATFNGETAFAYEVVKHKIDKTYGDILVDRFPVLKNLVPDNENTKGTDTERVNLAFIDSPKDKETIDSYYFQLQSLANEVALQKALPTAKQMGLSDKDYRQMLFDIAETFRKLPIVAFLQSGMNTNGRFSLTRVVDNSIIESMLLPITDNFIKKISQEDSAGKKDSLTSMFNAFKAANKRYDARGKNYIIPVGESGAPTNLLEDKMFINETGEEKTFDPTFVNNKGAVVKPYTRIGDIIQFKRTLGTIVNNFNSAEVANIRWDKSNIILEVDAILSDGTVSKHEFYYSPTGELVKYVTPAREKDGKVIPEKVYKTNLDQIIDTKDTVSVRIDMLKEFSDYSESRRSEIGDSVIYKMDYIRDGEKVVSFADAQITELEPIGYEFQAGPSGTYIYTNDVPLYRIKIRYETTFDDVTTVREVHNIIDANGNVKQNFNKEGKNYGVDSKNQFFVNLRSDRKKGQYAVQSVAVAEKMVGEGVIKPGTIVDVIDATTVDGVSLRRSNLMYLDTSDLKLKPLDEIYTGEEKKSEGFNIDATKFFTVFNEALNPGDNVAQTRASAVPLPKGSGVGNIDLKDRFIYHSNYQNKAGILSRLKYGGGSNVEFITDDENGGVKPEVKQMIDESIELVKKMRDQKGLTPVFNKAGYGQYMIGADDTTGKMFTDKAGNKIGEAAAPETFKYLSTRLLEEFGYINPNFVREAEGVKEVIRVAQQPITDEEYQDLMNKCFV